MSIGDHVRGVMCGGSEGPGNGGGCWRFRNALGFSRVRWGLGMWVWKAKMLHKVSPANPIYIQAPLRVPYLSYPTQKHTLVTFVPRAVSRRDSAFCVWSGNGGS